MWFEDLSGFKEENPNQVRLNLEIKGNTLILNCPKKGEAYTSFALLTVSRTRNLFTYRFPAIYQKITGYFSGL